MVCEILDLEEGKGENFRGVDSSVTITALGVRGNVHVFLVVLALAAASWPVTASTVATTGEIAARQTPVQARTVARQIAARIAETLLRMKKMKTRLDLAPVHHAAQNGASPKNAQARESAIPAHGPETQGRATPAAGACAIRATKPLVRRQVALISGNCSRYKFSHTGQAFKR